MDYKNLFNKAGMYFIGNLSSRILSTLLVPIYAFYVSTAALGSYDYTKTLMGIISPIMVVAIWEAILKFILSQDDDIIIKKVISTTVLFSAGTSFLFLLISIAVKSITKINVEYYYLIIFMIIVHSAVYIWQYIARSSNLNKIYVIAGVLSTFTNFISVMIFVMFLDWGLLGLYLSYILGQISIIIVIERRMKILSQISFEHFDLNILRTLIRYSAPLVLNIISAWFVTGFGKIIVTTKMGTEANGLFSFANNFSLLISMVGTVVTMAIIEEVILAVKNQEIDKTFGELMQKLFQVFLIIGIVGLPMIVIFYEYIKNTDYYSSLVFVPWLILYSIINTMSSNIGSIFQAMDKTEMLFSTTLFGGATSFAVSYFLIDYLGITGVIIGQILGVMLMFLLRYKMAKKLIKVTLKWKQIIQYLLLFVILSIIVLRVKIYAVLIIEIAVVILLLTKYKYLWTNHLKRRP